MRQIESTIVWKKAYDGRYDGDSTTRKLIYSKPLSDKCVVHMVNVGRMHNRDREFGVQAPKDPYVLSEFPLHKFCPSLKFPRSTCEST